MNGATATEAAGETATPSIRRPGPAHFSRGYNMDKDFEEEIASTMDRLLDFAELCETRPAYAQWAQESARQLGQVIRSVECRQPMDMVDHAAKLLGMS